MYKIRNKNEQKCILITGVEITTSRWQIRPFVFFPIMNCLNISNQSFSEIK